MLFKFLDRGEITVVLNIWEPGFFRDHTITMFHLAISGFDLIYNLIGNIRLKRVSPCNPLLASLLEFVTKLPAIRGRDGICKHVTKESIINEAGVKM